MYDFIVKYWLETLFSVVLGAITYVIKKIADNLKREMEDQKSIKLGVQAILRDRLIQSYNYHIEEGYCSIHDRDNISNMYEQYHCLGVNGVVDRLMDELLALPVKERPKKDQN